MTSFSDADISDARKRHLCIDCGAPAVQAPNEFWMDYCESCMPGTLKRALAKAYCPSPERLDTLSPPETMSENLKRYLSQVRYIQENDSRWSSERASQEHESRREYRSKLTVEEIAEANRQLGWPVPDTGKRFPIPGCGTVPWEDAEIAYKTYVKAYGDDQSLEKLADRGGFGLLEFCTLYTGCDMTKHGARGYNINTPGVSVAVISTIQKIGKNWRLP